MNSNVGKKLPGSAAREVIRAEVEEKNPPPLLTGVERFRLVNSHTAVTLTPTETTCLRPHLAPVATAPRLRNTWEMKFSNARAVLVLLHSSVNAQPTAVVPLLHVRADAGCASESKIS